MSCGTGVHGCISGAFGSATCPDDADAIQACLNENPGAHIYFTKVRGLPPSPLPASLPPDYYLSKPIVPCGSDQRLDGSSGMQSVGTLLRFASGSAGIEIIKNTTLSASTPCPYPYAPQGVRIESMFLNGGTATPGSVQAGANGITIRSTFARVDNVTTQYFGQHGIEIWSDISQGYLPDAFQLTHVIMQGNRGDGLYVHGGDTNVGTVINSSAIGNGGWGFNDDSFLGNTYVQPHASTNVLGAYRSPGAVSNNLFLNPYAELGQPKSDIGPASMVIGGTGMDYDWSKFPSVLRSNNSVGFNSSPISFQAQSYDPGAVLQDDPVVFHTNGYDQNDRWGAFNALNKARGPAFFATDALSLRRTSDGVTATTGLPGERDNGWWGFRVNGIGNGPGLYNYPFLMSDSLSTTGPGWGWFPNGFYIGQVGGAITSARRRISVSSTLPGAGSGSLGDIVLNTDPVAGGSLGWVKVVGGAWVAFGPVGETATSASTTSGTLSAFFPGSLTGAWIASTWTPDKPITVTQIQAQAKTPPNICGTNAVIRITDGVNSVSTAITAAANTTSGASQTFSAGVPLRVELDVPAVGCATNPSDVNVVVQYRMQQ